MRWQGKSYSYNNNTNNNKYKYTNDNSKNINNNINNMYLFFCSFLCPMAVSMTILSPPFCKLAKFFCHKWKAHNIHSCEWSLHPLSLSLSLSLSLTHTHISALNYGFCIFKLFLHLPPIWWLELNSNLVKIAGENS